MESLQPLSSVLLQPGSDNLNYETRRVRQGSRTDRRPSAGDRMIPQLPGRSFDLLAPTLLFLFFIAPAATGDPEILPKPRPGVICARNQSMKDFSICIFLFEGRKKNKIKKKKVSSFLRGPFLCQHSTAAALLRSFEDRVVGLSFLNFLPPPVPLLNPVVKHHEMKDDNLTSEFLGPPLPGRFS